MQLISHDARHYTDALKALLPLGAAWDWAVGSFGDSLVLATAQELARIDTAAQGVLDDAIEVHCPALNHYTLAAYQAVADAATHIIPRKPATIGCTVGYRLWSQNAPVSVSPAPVVTLSHQIPAASVSCRVGALLWSVSCRYYLRVQFDKSIINKVALYSALMSFKQAHVYLYVEDVADMGE